MNKLENDGMQLNQEAFANAVCNNNNRQLHVEKIKSELGTPLHNIEIVKNNSLTHS